MGTVYPIELLVVPVSKKGLFALLSPDPKGGYMGDDVPVIRVCSDSPVACWCDLEEHYPERILYDSIQGLGDTETVQTPLGDFTFHVRGTD